jgi:hypothetical protein
MTRELRALGATSALLSLFAFSLLTFGCGEAVVEGGLANAPAANRTTQPHNQHDVISDGPNSCGKGEPGAQYRPACETHDTPAPAPPPAPPQDEEKKDPQ